MSVLQTYFNCYVFQGSSFWVTCSSGKAESTHKLSISNLKIWNLKSPRIWNFVGVNLMPQWKIPYYKMFFHEKKNWLHKVTFRVQGICETLMNFEFRFGFHLKTTSCVYANIPKSKQIWTLKYIWSWAFLVRDAQPVLFVCLVYSLSPLPCNGFG